MEEKIFDETDWDIPPTLKLYWSDTFGYIDVYREELIDWFNNEFLPNKIKESEKALKDNWDNENEFMNRIKSDCPAIQKQEVH